MRTIYRVQNKEGKGPYKGRKYSRWTERSHDTTKHPNAYQDKKLRKLVKTMKPREFSSYKFGFKSMASLNRWFSKKELQNLKKLGFEVVSLKAKTVILGDRQVLFK